MSVTARVSTAVGLVLIVPLLGACAGDAASDEAGAVARRFVAAADDPARACELLAPDTREQLSQNRPCPRELATVDLARGQKVEDVYVAGHSARVLTSSDVLFLALFDDGWRVTAADCERAAADDATPYDCTISGS